jgi:hypothetical protein
MNKKSHSETVNGTAGHIAAVQGLRPLIEEYREALTKGRNCPYRLQTR